MIRTRMAGFPDNRGTVRYPTALWLPNNFWHLQHVSDGINLSNHKAATGSGDYKSRAVHTRLKKIMRLMSLAQGLRYKFGRRRILSLIPRDGICAEIGVLERGFLARNIAAKSQGTSSHRSMVIFSVVPATVLWRRNREKSARYGCHSGAGEVALRRKSRGQDFIERNRLKRRVNSLNFILIGFILMATTPMKRYWVILLPGTRK